MLIVCNGAQKGGSSWIYNIANLIRPAKKIPHAYQQEGYRSSYIAFKELDAFINETDWRTNDYSCKQHWFSRQKVKALANDPDSRFVSIIRDIRDVLVSRYHHDIRLGNVPKEIDFKSYYHLRGAQMMQHYCSYQFYWHRDLHEADAEPLLMSYEGLKFDFIGQVRLLGEFLNVELDSIDYERAYNETAIESIGIYDHYRKGIIGDWVNHFDREMASIFEGELRSLVD